MATNPNPQFAYDASKTNPNIKDGRFVAPNYQKGTLDYSTSDCANKESEYMAALMAEALHAAAGPVNVFPMLGVHNQGSTVDQATDGYPLSSGAQASYSVANAFTIEDNSWRSVETGAQVLTAYLGYDFGTKKAWTATATPQERYQPAEPVRKKISTLKIRQGDDPTMRALQLRVEASDDGVSWKRVDVVSLQNVNTLVTVGIRSTTAYNKWRFVPVFFGGVAANAPWEVVEMHLLEETQVSLDNIQDELFLENRDRSYSPNSVMIKCTYDLLDVQTDLAKFGINLPQTYIFTCSFATMIEALGRPVIVGDLLELPGEVQYDANLRPVRKWLEVTDASWATEGYTINWKPQLFKFYAQPAMPSVELRDILGTPGKVVERQTDDSLEVDGLLQNILAYQASEDIAQTSDDLVPQTGSDPQDIQSGKSSIGGPGTYDGRDLYVQDAIPPNGEPYTVGDALPAANTIADGHWHRQTYTNISADIRPPERLLKWDASIQRWHVVEVNTRTKPESHKKTIAKMLKSESRIDLDKQV